MSLMWMPAQTTVPPFGDDPQRGRHQGADRREDQRGVERLGRRRVGAAGPDRAELAGETPAVAASPGRVKA